MLTKDMLCYERALFSERLRLVLKPSLIKVDISTAMYQTVLDRGRFNNWRGGSVSHNEFMPIQLFSSSTR